MKTILSFFAFMVFSFAGYAGSFDVSPEERQRMEQIREAKLNEFKNQLLLPKHGIQTPVARQNHMSDAPIFNGTKNQEADGQWISWDNGLNANLLGSVSIVNWEVAARFTPSDLALLQGKAITQMRVFLGDEADVILKVWQGENAQQLLHSQPLTGYQILDWTTVELTIPVLIDVTQELWIGYTLSAPEATFAAGIDHGPVVSGKGDLIRFNSGGGNNNEWLSGSDLAGLSFNWNIQAFVETIAEPGSPSNPTNLIATAAENGELSVNLSWTNPTTTFDGQELTTLSSINIFRNQALVHTITNPAIGASETFTDDNLPESGAFLYTVVGTNEEGQGLPASASVFAGEDVPGAPVNVTLTDQNNAGFLSWDAPLSGINNGFINPSLTTYTVKRMPDATVVAQNISTTSFLDNSVPGIGNYFYEITAGNNLGTGGTAVSNVAFLGGDGLLFLETFDYPPGTIPAGWQIAGTTSHNWAVGHSNMAGGTAPELVLSWIPSSTGLSRLVSPVINTEGHNGLRLSFRQYLDNFASSNNESVAVEFSTDGGNTWQIIWEEDLVNQDIPQGLYNFVFNLPQGTNSVQIAFRFQGNSTNIDYWYIDDVLVEPLFGNNLAALSVTGNTNPIVAIESVYTVRVANYGENAQNNYTVKLMGEGDVELASLPGQLIQSGETIDFELPWTPTLPGSTFVYGLVEFDEDENPSDNATPNLNVQVQPEGTYMVKVGNGTLPVLNMPFNFFWKTNLAQTIYYPEELGISGGAIIAIKYDNVFAQDIGEKEVRLWMGETDMEDMSENWVDFESLTLVYEGIVNFPEGQNEILITLDTPYAYNGSNLVVYSQRVWENIFYSSANRFYATQDILFRTRFLNSDNQVDPANPPTSNLSLQHPNTTFYFSLAGLGSLEGTIVHNDEPLESVEVKVAGSALKTISNSAGFYSFPFIVPGEYVLEFSKFGYFPQSIDQVVILEDETTILDIEMEAIPQFTLSGVVEGNDGLVPDQISISLTGYDNYEATAAADGSFEVIGIYQGEYILNISAPGYNSFTDANLLVESDTDLGTVILNETIFPPAGLAIDYDNFGAGNALLTWNQGMGEFEFRYDNGTVSDALGTFNATNNTTLGAAHPNSAEIYEMSWIIPLADDYNIQDVNVWVFGLDENGIPSRHDLLYSATNVPNNDGEWTTYQFSQPVNAPNGFFMGIGTEGFLVIATDNGTDPEWPFNPNTHFVNFDVTAQDFHTIESFGFNMNFFIRAIGNNFGALKNGISQPDPVVLNLTSDVLQRSAITPFSPSAPDAGLKNSSTKAFTGFNVYLNDLETPLSFTDETEFLFTGLDEGSQLAGVQSVYTTGVSDIVTIEFDVTFPVEVTINTSTNTGESSQGASVTLTNQENSVYTYSDTADENGTIFFGSVRKGVYLVEASLENHQDIQLIDVEILEDFVLNLEFTEVIDAPRNLMVVTEGLEPGQALFSWNNPTHGWEESFEGGQLPENWTQIINNTNSQNGYDATWRIVGTVPFSNTITPKDGNYQAFVMWSFQHQDEWLISPEFTAPAGDLVFWYHGTNGSAFGDNFYVKITTNGGNTWATLWNASNLPSGVNHYQTPVTIDLSLYAGQEVKLAWHAQDGPSGIGLWSSWAIDQITVGGEPMDLKDFITGTGNTAAHGMNKSALGYNVFLDGVQVAEEIEDSQFLFNNVADGPRTAGVQAVYASGVSEIVTMEFVLNETWLLSLVSSPAGSGSLSGAAWYAEGSQVLVNALPNENYTFVSWTNTAGQIISEQAGFFFTMPGNDVVLIANFMEAETYNVTLNIDMSAAEFFNPFDENVAVTGSMHNWAVLGANHRNQTMADTQDPMIYSITFAMSPGTYEYKYFLNEGIHDHEWEEGPNRVIFVDSDLVINDVWGMPTSVSELSESSVKLFPNPFTEFIEIAGADETERIIITDITGRVLISRPLDNTRLDTSMLPQGVYIIYLERNGQRQHIEKMIKK
jgi:hypothetical protein